MNTDGSRAQIEHSAIAPGAVTVHVLRLPALTAGAVAELAAVLQARDDGAPCVIDLSALQTFVPSGLAALIEFGRGQGGLRELMLAGLTRALTMAAVESGLAERFDIYVSVEAALEGRGP